MSPSIWARGLLASVGILLTLTGLALIIMPFVAAVSGLVAAPGVGVLGLGVLLIVLSAYYDSSEGAAKILGWSIRFGKGPTDQRGPPPARG